MRIKNLTKEVVHQIVEINGEYVDLGLQDAITDKENTSGKTEVRSSKEDAERD